MSKKNDTTRMEEICRQLAEAADALAAKEAEIRKQKEEQCKKD